MAEEQKPKQEEAPKTTNPPAEPTLTEEEKKFANSTGRPVNEKTSMDVNRHDKILKLGFITTGGQSDASTGSEIVDVVTEYYWTQNKPRETNTNMIASVPFLYAVEYKQKYGVTATNLFNNIYALSNAGKSIGQNSGISNLYGTVSTGLKQGFDKLKDTIGSALELSGGGKGSHLHHNIGGAFSKLGGYLSEMATDANKIIQAPWAGNTFLNTEMLYPYFYLYSLEATNKKFCFPFFTEGASSWQIANSFGSEGSQGLLSKTISSTLDALVGGMVKFAADVQDIGSFMSGGTQAGGFTMYNIEKAKAFSFPSGGKTVSVKFPLFNTVKMGEWEKNYRFIFLFAIRNMLFRKNNVEYYPPLFYDVSIPGFGRMPLSYVKTFSVKPVGMTRVKSIELNLGFGKYTKTTVVVPEAWVVQIDFESLIADSANQYLSSMVDLKINANLTTD